VSIKIPTYIFHCTNWKFWFENIPSGNPSGQSLQPLDDRSDSNENLKEEISIGRLRADICRSCLSEPGRLFERNLFYGVLLVRLNVLHVYLVHETGSIHSLSQVAM
jgi:hypothetical protein